MQSVRDGGAAHRAGIDVDDQIIKVDLSSIAFDLREWGRQTVQVVVDRVKSALIASLSAQRRAYDYKNRRLSMHSNGPVRFPRRDCRLHPCPEIEYSSEYETIVF